MSGCVCVCMSRGCVCVCVCVCVCMSRGRGGVCSCHSGIPGLLCPRKLGNPQAPWAIYRPDLCAFILTSFRSAPPTPVTNVHVSQKSQTNLQFKSRLHRKYTERARTTLGIRSDSSPFTIASLRQNRYNIAFIIAKFIITAFSFTSFYS